MEGTKMSYNYNSIEMQSMIDNFDKLATGDYTTARDYEKKVISYATRLNTANKKTALESVSNYATLSCIFNAVLPKYQTISVHLVKVDKVYQFDYKWDYAEGPVIDAYKALQKECGYSPVNWTHIGYSLLSLINVEFDQNDIINFKPCTIGQIKDLLSYFGNCSSKMVRTMCEMLKPTFKKNGTNVLVKITDEQVMKVYAEAKAMNLMTKQYGEKKEA